METKQKSIFLIDDDQFLLKMYETKFKNSGFVVAVSASALSALQRLRDGFAPDIVLIDLVMPGMDGLEFIKHLKDEGLAKGAPIVVLSNQGQKDEVGRAKELGIDDYIVKASMIPSEVVEKVKRILKG
jgi:CheY-like chemotaxis protein